ncbi:MAG: PQQ-binding-like beta-propeller repeat protein, partial [Planctomycetota bacterium]
MGIRRTVTLAAASLTLAAAPALAQDRSQDWTHWRGPLGSGASPAADPPLEWSDTKNVKWKAQIPGEGYSTPIVNDGVIYVMTAVDTGRAGAGPSNIFSYRVIALSLESGRELWSTTIKEEPPHGGLHQTNVEISASPIIAGSRLYAFFGSRGVFCLDLKGDVIWDRDLGDMRTRNDFGEGA